MSPQKRHRSSGIATGRKRKSARRLVTALAARYEFKQKHQDVNCSSRGRGRGGRDCDQNDSQPRPHALYRPSRR